LPLKPLLALTLSLAAAGIATPTFAGAGNPPSYFPLHDKDRWVYVLIPPTSDHQVHVPSRPDSVEIVEIAGSSSIDGRSLYTLANYLFPFSEDKSVFYNDSPGSATEMWNGRPGVWYPWWEFTGQQLVPVVLPGFTQDCIHGSCGDCIGLRTVTVPAATFERAAVIHYDLDPCVDSGLTEEIFAPNVGLIQRSVASWSGLQTWSLVYAEVGDRIWGDPQRSHPTGASETIIQGTRSPAARTTTWGTIKSTFRSN
jgi:hypothetical protein